MVQVCYLLLLSLKNVSVKFIIVTPLFQVSERDRNLDNAILQSGKFNDAFMNLMDWLKETEGLVSNQKAPSPDFKVAKAQLQEQKVNSCIS